LKSVIRDSVAQTLISFVIRKEISEVCTEAKR